MHGFSFVLVMGYLILLCVHYKYLDLHNEQGRYLNSKLMTDYSTGYGRHDLFHVIKSDREEISVCGADA